MDTCMHLIAVVVRARDRLLPQDPEISLNQSPDPALGVFLSIGAPLVDERRDRQTYA